MSDKGPIFILSIDGGGSRGAIPANVLYHMEHDAGIPVRETFDFFAGVSTGAMVAAYLARDAGDAISGRHLARAVWAELNKDNRQVRRSELGDLADHLEETA